MEGVVCSMTLDEWPSRKIFAAMRSAEGEEMVLQHNVFVEKILPRSILRELTQDEIDEYRRPFAVAGEDRRPTLTWPREMPLSGEPTDVVKIVDDYSAWLASSDIPKLFINAEPGAILTGRMREVCRAFPNQQETTVRASISFRKTRLTRSLRRSAVGCRRYNRVRAHPLCRASSFVSTLRRPDGPQTRSDEAGHEQRIGGSLVDHYSVGCRRARPSRNTHSRRASFTAVAPCGFAQRGGDVFRCSWRASRSGTGPVPRAWRAARTLWSRRGHQNRLAAIQPLIPMYRRCTHDIGTCRPRWSP